MIRAYVVAASPVVRAGLRALLEEGGGIEVVDALAPADVLVIDADPDSAALEAEGPPAVILTDDADGLRQTELWPSRVRALLPRNVAPNELVAAIQAVAAGFVVLRPEEAERSILPPRLATTSAGEKLTPREQEVLQMIAAGESNKRIAYRLGISEHTVKFHVASVLSKLNAGSRAEALAIGVRRGLIYL